MNDGCLSQLHSAAAHYLAIILLKENIVENPNEKPSSIVFECLMSS
jgi:hypothetical protein